MPSQLSADANQNQQPKRSLSFLTGAYSRNWPCRVHVINRQAILELRARPGLPLCPPDPILGAPSAHPGLADGSRFGSLNLERVEPDHTTSRMKALAYRFDDPSY